MSHADPINLKFKIDSSIDPPPEPTWGWNCVHCGHHFGKARDIVGHCCKQRLDNTISRIFYDKVFDEFERLVLYGTGGK